MKFLHTVLALLVGCALFAQEPRIIPPDYEKVYEERKQFIEDNQSPDKIFLDPIEQTPVAPSSYSALANGNWAYTYYGVHDNTGWIQDNIQRKVAIIIFDTAGKFTHPALQQFVWNTHNRVFTGEPAADGNGHGTHVASCYAGNHPAGFYMGPATVLGENLKLIAYKVMRNQGFGYTNEIAQGFRTANTLAEQLISEGWFVIYQMSFGSQSVNGTFDSIIEEAEEIGVYVSAAAGNNGQEFIGTPANGSSAHAIGAIDNNGKRASFSNFGPELYMMGPGVRVYGCWGAEGYAELSGTSMGSPTHGAMVAIQAATSTATARQISHFHRTYAENLGTTGWDKYYGYGYALLDNMIEDDPERFPDESNGNPDTPNPDPDPGDPDDPDDPDDPGDPDDPEPPTKGKQKVVFDLQHEYPVLWQAHGSGKWRTTYIKMNVEYTSDLYADTAEDALEIGTAAFFTNRAFVVMPTDDFANAAYWVRHFYEMIMEDRGYDVKVTEYWSIDEQGRRAYEDKARRNGIRFAITRLVGPLATFQVAETPEVRIKNP